ncbi:sugar phosphate isomerase/epimerase [Aerococcaceae bacterium DSM 111176]|nr:sugar phosphate isomerase/epimerase [Aerococcaceae bacterium DSM 111176]
MNRSGLVSVTFRQKTTEEVIELVQRAKLDGIEWGSDVHVPIGDLENAKSVGAQTRAADLDVVAYGSYYRAGIKNEYPFSDVLETAVALGAPAIRVWAGDKGTERVSDEEWKAVADDIYRIADLANEENIQVHLEYHAATLTDSAENTMKVLNAINHPNVFTYWQPSVGRFHDERLNNIKQVAPRLANVHVFNWDFIFRLPLAEAQQHWQDYVDAINSIQSEYTNSRYFMLEFVKDDQESQFEKDAEILLELIK